MKEGKQLIIETLETHRGLHDLLTGHSSCGSY